MNKLPQEKSISNQWRTVRVFISSTFDDLHAERDYLIKVVFPELREKLIKYHIRFIDIDLRWGITKEQADNDEVLELCLDQIDECRPFFIGILGHRYGWVPQKFPVNLLNKFGWIQHHTGKSLTELEILHGVLNNPSFEKRAFFYFRDKKSLNGIPKKIRKAKYIETDPKLAEKLENLKGKILSSGLFVMDPYPAKWERKIFDSVTETKGRLVGLDNFGQSVIDNLWTEIKSEFSLPDKPLIEIDSDPINKERSLHEIYEESLLHVFVGRDKLIKMLLSYIENDSTEPILILGQPGIGKSSTLAKLCRVISNKYPKTLLIQYFIGAGTKSTNIQSALEYLCDRINKNFNFKNIIPNTLLEIIKTFRSFIFRIQKDDKLVLIIDGIDRFDEYGQPNELNWLPNSLPSNVKIVLSSSIDNQHKSKIIEKAKELSFQKIEMEELTDTERREIIKKIPSISAKTLDKSQVNLLLKNIATANPLYLKIALEELKGFGSFKNLNKRINNFPKPSKTIDIDDALSDLFIQVIKRLEKEFNITLVQNLLKFICCSRNGLSEMELLELIDDPRSKEDLFIVLRQLRPYLIQKGDLVDFYHGNLREGINKYFISDFQIRKTYHYKLAQYFEQGENEYRRISELPWQLVEAKEWKKLQRYLMDLDFLEKIWSTQKSDVLKYWSLLESKTEYKIAESYSFLLSEPAKFSPEVLRIVANLFEETGNSQVSKKLREFLLEYYQNTGDYYSLIGILNDFSINLQHEGIPKAGLIYLNKAESHARSLGEEANLARILSNKGSVLIDIGEIDNAFKILSEARSIAMNIRDNHTLATVVANLAAAHICVGNFQRAEELYKEEEAIYRSVGDWSGIAHSLLNLANLIKKRGELDKAVNLLENAKKICEDFGFKIIDGSIIKSNADIHLLRSEYEKALEEYNLSISIFEKALYKPGIIGSLLGKAHVNDICGDFEEAIKIYEETEQLCMETIDNQGLIGSLTSKAQIYAKTSKIDHSMEINQKAESLCREYGYKDNLQVVLGHMATIHRLNNNYIDALRLNEEKVNLCRQLGNTNSLIVAMGNLANVHTELGNLNEAMELQKEKQKISKDIGNKKSLAFSLGGEGAIWAMKEEYDEALRCYKEQEIISREIACLECLCSSLMNQAYILTGRGVDYKFALSKAEEALEIMTRTGLFPAFLRKTEEIISEINYLM